MDNGSRGRAPGRRAVLRVAGGLAVGAVAGGLVATRSGGAAVSVADTASTGAAGSGGAGKAFVHPGLLHTEADFARMRARVRAKAQPWQAGWEVLTANSHSSSAWKPDPLVTVIRGGSGAQNYPTLYNDIAAAYQNALRWKITGDRANGNAARDILNAWSATLKTVTGDADRFIAAGIYGYEFANAAEIMRGYPGFDLGRFQAMMLNVFYPMNNAFLTKHNGAYITNYWGSWDMLTMASILAIGILCDQPAKVSQAISYFKHGAGNGSVPHEMPHLYPGGLAQWIEVGRDQGHATLGVGLMGAICQMAWNQGYDLYSCDDNRFLKGAEYVAKYNLGHSVPYTPYTWFYGAPGVWSGSQTFTAASPDSRGDIRPIWEMLYNHYVRRRGLHAPYIAAFAAKVRPEGGGGNYGPDSGGYDQLGFGTLTYTL